MAGRAAVAIDPPAFLVVEFDAATVARLASEVADSVGLPSSLAITIVVDEQSMLSKGHLRTVDPVLIEVPSGAFEDRSRPRRLSEVNLIDELARLLQRAADRLDARFAGAPPEEDLSPQQAAAWDASCLGRTARWQAAPLEGRHRYDFFLACGFGPGPASAFESLWNAMDIDWAGIESLTPPPPRPVKAPRRGSA